MGSFEQNSFIRKGAMGKVFKKLLHKNLGVERKL